MGTASDFWTWFEANQAQFLFVHEVEPAEADRMLQELHTELKAFDDELFFQIGGKADSVKEIVITAEGNKSKFEAVQALVSLAPTIKNWQVVAFKPAMGLDFSVQINDRELTPNELFFKPLKSSANPDALGLRIGLPVYDEKQRKEQLQLTYLILETVLGELSFAQDIDYVDIIALSNPPDKDGFIRMNRLEEFIQWKKDKGTFKA